MSSGKRLGDLLRRPSVERHQAPERPRLFDRLEVGPHGVLHHLLSQYVRLGHGAFDELDAHPLEAGQAAGAQPPLADEHDPGALLGVVADPDGGELAKALDAVGEPLQFRLVELGARLRAARDGIDGHLSERPRLDRALVLVGGRGGRGGCHPGARGDRLGDVRPEPIQQRIALAHAAPLPWSAARSFSTRARISPATASIAFAGAPFGFQKARGWRATTHSLKATL
jgi:hypothetical protein